MKKFILKLRARTGESFAEVLVALLIVAFATLLLVGMYSASGAINTSVKKMDDDFYDALSNVETGAVEEEEDGTVTISGEGFNVTIDVDIYTDGTFTSYKKAVT